MGLLIDFFSYLESFSSISTLSSSSASVAQVIWLLRMGTTILRRKQEDRRTFCGVFWSFLGLAGVFLWETEEGEGKLSLCSEAFKYFYSIYSAKIL